MDFAFETQGTNTYLVYTVQSKDTIDTMSLGMLTNNKILGLAPTQFMQMDDVLYVKYNVSAHISVKQFFSGLVNKKRLVSVFRGIVNAMLSAEEYMLDTKSIILDLEYIFVDVTTCETILISLPIANNELLPTDVGSFFKNIVFTSQFDPTENCDYVAKIINFLNRSPNFSFSEFKLILDSIENDLSGQNVKQNHVQTPLKNTETMQSEKVVPKSTRIEQPQLKTIPTNVPGPVPITKTTKTFVPQIEQNVTPAEEEQKITLLYLLQHYNKDNAAIYKAQKNAKKDKKVKKDKEKSTVINETITVPGIPIANNRQLKSQSLESTGSDPFQKQPITVGNLSVSIPKNSFPTVQPAKSQELNLDFNQYTTPITDQSDGLKQIADLGQNMNFGETTILGAGMAGETTVLMAGKNPEKVISPHLIRSKNNEQIPINKPVFRVGKERSYVDYFVGDNTAISRSHANIITRDGDYFVMDTNSTNHTFVNGTMIQSNVETRINHGDIIRLANEDFEFRIY